MNYTALMPLGYTSTILLNEALRNEPKGKVENTISLNVLLDNYAEGLGQQFEIADCCVDLSPYKLLDREIAVFPIAAGFNGDRVVENHEYERELRKVRRIIGIGWCGSHRARLADITVPSSYIFSFDQLGLTNGMFDNELRTLYARKLNEKRYEFRSGTVCCCLSPWQVLDQRDFDFRDMESGILGAYGNKYKIPTMVVLVVSDVKDESLSVKDFYARVTSSPFKQTFRTALEIILTL